MSGIQPLASVPNEKWRQYIEYRTTGIRNAFPISWFTSQYTCDNDPDTDYVYKFNINYFTNPNSFSPNPNGLRWGTTNSALYIYINLWCGVNNLSGYSDSWSYAYYCLGEGAVNWVGGNAVVMSAFVARY
jgi:hypothetical protein